VTSDLDAPATAELLGQLADKQAIREVVLRYCRGIDRLDMELVRSCYHPDGVDHHTGFTGARDDYVRWVGTQLQQLELTQHVMANQLIELDGDLARSETYGTAYHLARPGGEGPASFTTGFRYVDRFERRDGEWRIAERFAVREWIRDEVHQRLAEPGAGPPGARDRSDPIYQPLR
jgi:hypothetical protein